MGRSLLTILVLLLSLLSINVDVKASPSQDQLVLVGVYNITSTDSSWHTVAGPFNMTGKYVVVIENACYNATDFDIVITMGQPTPGSYFSGFYYSHGPPSLAYHVFAVGNLLVNTIVYKENGVFNATFILDFDTQTTNISITHSSGDHKSLYHALGLVMYVPENEWYIAYRNNINATVKVYKVASPGNQENTTETVTQTVTETVNKTVTITNTVTNVETLTVNNTVTRYIPYNYNNSHILYAVAGVFIVILLALALMLLTPKKH